jgi:hypothetical protein
MPAGETQRAPKGEGRLRIEFVWAADPAIGPRNGRLEHPLVICALDAEGAINVRLACEADLRRSGGAR